MSVRATKANMESYRQSSRSVGGVVIFPKQPVAYSPITDERYSADPGDYWHMDERTCLKDSQGNDMELVFEREVLIPADANEDFTRLTTSFFDTLED